MANSSVRAGLKRVSINGETVDVTAEGLTYSFGGVQYTEIVGADRFHGVAGKPIAAFMQFTVTDASRLKAAGLLDKAGVTVTATLMSGKTLVLTDAVNTSERTGESTEGKIPLRFVGSSLTELQG